MSELKETAKKVVENSSDDELAGIIVSLGRYAFSEKRKQELQTQLSELWENAYYDMRWFSQLNITILVGFIAYLTYAKSGDLTFTYILMFNILLTFDCLANKILVKEKTM